MWDRCHSCGSSDLKTEREVEDCRRNGDAYGTETITCRACCWFTSNKFDDAPETYYYETAYQCPREPVNPQVEPLTEELEKSFAKMAKLKISRDAIRRGMILRRIREQDIETFMSKYNVE
eukprot:gene36419-44179_t